MGNESEQGFNTDGLPVPPHLPQLDHEATPYRDEAPIAFKEGVELEEEPTDYFKDEEERLNDPQAPFVTSKHSEDWSEGMEDEANAQGFAGFNAVDAEDTEEAVVPEFSNLTVEGTLAEQSAEELSAMELQPDNIQEGSE